MISVPEHGFSRSSLCHPRRTASDGRLLKIICVVETLLWIWPLMFSLKQMSSELYTRSETDLFLTICFPVLAFSWGGFLYSVIAVFFPLDQMLLGKSISHRSLLWRVQQSVNAPQDSSSRFVESRCYLSCLNISDSHLGVFAKLAFSVELQNGSLQRSLCSCWGRQGNQYLSGCWHWACISVWRWSPVVCCCTRFTTSTPSALVAGDGWGRDKARWFSLERRPKCFHLIWLACHCRSC